MFNDEHWPSGPYDPAAMARVTAQIAECARHTARHLDQLIYEAVMRTATIGYRIEREAPDRRLCASMLEVAKSLPFDERLGFMSP